MGKATLSKTLVWKAAALVGGLSLGILSYPAHAASASGGDTVQGLYEALASTMKNGRTLGQYVPLYPEIVKRLIPYMEKQVAEHGHGPLFRHLPKDKNGKRSTYVARKIDEWMDGVIKDPNLAPNHSFRHYLKSELLARDVPERISDAITGHKTPGIGRKYEHVEMWKKFDAISKLPVIPLQAA